jgi:hypothetical protein
LPQNKGGCAVFVDATRKHLILYVVFKQFFLLLMPVKKPLPFEQQAKHTALFSRTQSGPS